MNIQTVSQRFRSVRFFEEIRRNVLLIFVRLCMETPCLCPSEGHKYGGRKLTKTDVIEFAIKSL